MAQPGQRQSIGRLPAYVYHYTLHTLWGEAWYVSAAAMFRSAYLLDLTFLKHHSETGDL